MYVFYHSRDFDGFCSGAICKKKYPDATLIGYDYGQDLSEIQAISPGVPVIMVDVSLTMDQMVYLGMHTRGQFTWIDHHASAIKDYEALKKGSSTGASFIKPILQQGIAACEITWNYLFPNEEMPAAVSLLGQYDTWRNENKTNWDLSVLPFQYGLKLWDIDSAYTFPQMFLNDDKENQQNAIKNTINDGHIALKYQKGIDKTVMQSAFECEFEGLKAIACNGSGIYSMSFDAIPNLTDYDLMIPFKYNGSIYSFSLYSTKVNVDCSVLAKKYGGGGHKSASGFITDKLPSFLTKN